MMSMLSAGRRLRPLVAAALLAAPPLAALDTYQVTLRNRTAIPFRVTGQVLTGDDPGVDLAARTSLTLEVQEAPDARDTFLWLDPLDGEGPLVLPCRRPPAATAEGAAPGGAPLALELEGPEGLACHRSARFEAPGRCIWTLTAPVRFRPQRRAVKPKTWKQAAKERAAVRILEALAGTLTPEQIADSMAKVEREIARLEANLAASRNPGGVVARPQASKRKAEAEQPAVAKAAAPCRDPKRVKQERDDLVAPPVESES